MQIEVAWQVFINFVYISYFILWKSCSLNCFFFYTLALRPPWWNCRHGFFFFKKSSQSLKYSTSEQIIFVY